MALVNNLIAANTGGVVNISTTEAALTGPVSISNANNQVVAITLLGQLPGNAYTSFTVRCGPNGGPTDNVVCVLQNNVVSFAQAQTDVSNWQNTYPGEVGYVYNFPANRALSLPKQNVLEGTLYVAVTGANGVSNTAVVSVYAKEAVNNSNPLAQASGLLGSNTVNVGSSVITITGLVANSFSITWTAAAGFAVANIAPANGSVFISTGQTVS